MHSVAKITVSAASFLAKIIVFSVLVGTAYCVLFFKEYPLTAITREIVTLCAVLGLATCLAAVGIWKKIAR
jgi:hypothetical protein